MFFEGVKEYFDGVGLGKRVKSLEQIGAMVEQAALSIDCEPERITKTMSFFHGEEAALIVMAGDAKIDNIKYKIGVMKMKNINIKQVDAFRCFLYININASK